MLHYRYATVYEQLKIRELLLLNSDCFLYFKRIYKFQDSTHLESVIKLQITEAHDHTTYLRAEVALQRRIPRLQINTNLHSN